MWTPSSAQAPVKPTPSRSNKHVPKVSATVVGGAVALANSGRLPFLEVITDIDP